jgi:hypothetical protein
MRIKDGLAGLIFLEKNKFSYFSYPSCPNWNSGRVYYIQLNEGSENDLQEILIILVIIAIYISNVVLPYNHLDKTAERSV